MDQPAKDKYGKPIETAKAEAPGKKGLLARLGEAIRESILRSTSTKN